MAYEQILTETRGRVGIVTLNRPERLNAWTAQMGEEIIDQVTAWNDDPAIGAIVVTGKGRAFCAGADLGGFAERAKTNAQGTGEAIRRGGAPFTHFMRQSKPTIAAVNGYAMGIGLTMILPMDIRLASTSAGLSIRFIKMGLMPELGSTRLLSQLVGLGNATEIRLVHDFVIHVIKSIEFADNLPRHLFLYRQQGRLLVEGMDLVFANFADAVDVIGGLHGAVIPLRILIHRCEQIHLNHDPLPPSSSHTIPQSGEKSLIPFLKIKFVAPMHIPRLAAASPRADQLSLSRSQRVALNVEGPLRFDITSGKHPCQIQPIGGESVKIF